MAAATTSAPIEIPAAAEALPPADEASLLRLTCEECFEELDRYVELAPAGEPDDARVAGMRAHLDGCPACAADFADLRGLVSRADQPPK